MAEVTVDALSGWRIAETGPLRAHVRPENRRSAHYLDRFDRRTLIYDCVALPAGGCVVTAPRFLNLWPIFRGGLRVGGVRPRRVKRRTWLRCEQVVLPDGAVTLDLGDGPVPLTPRASLAPRFAGRDCLVAVNRNNDLGWIADWAAYHAGRHRASGLVLFDNGSDAYTLEALAAALRRVPGLAQAAILSAPFPYGPVDRSLRREVSPRFFQTAMLNIARRDALAGAAATLSVDIDEIVRGPESQTVFDAARRHPLGCITIDGSWVFPAPDTDGPTGHWAHTWRAVPDDRCNPKWCAAAWSPLNRFGWAVHRMDEVFQPLLTRQRRFRLLHCRATSTGWKATRFQMPAEVVQDPDLDTFMQTHFRRG